MGKERDHEQKWGKSLIGPFLFFVIDSYLQARPSKGPVKGRLTDAVNMIVAQLVIDKVPFDTLEHLKVCFVPPEINTEGIGPNDKDLEEIKKIISGEFGREVAERIKLEINMERVRTLPH
jgi:hypothetical protein